MCRERRTIKGKNEELLYEQHYAGGKVGLQGEEGQSKMKRGDEFTSGEHLCLI